jgi:hypothetical protein
LINVMAEALQDYILTKDCECVIIIKTCLPFTGFGSTGYQVKLHG